jgi:hypothetical protein
VNQRGRTRDLELKMKDTSEHNLKVAKLVFGSVYPHYVKKVETKGRTQEELIEVIQWLTGFDEAALNQQIESGATFEQFFADARLNPNADLITGVICGYRIEEIENPLTRQVRYLDKLVDELAKGRKMEKILRGQRFPQNAYLQSSPYRGTPTILLDNP